METKNFLGLDGLNHFWEKAKVWIINEISTKIAGIVLNSVPVGTVLSGLYTTVPDGFLLCDGQEVAIESFHKLYTEIGSLACCQSSNTGMFKIPDLREVVLVGTGQSTRAEIAEHDVYTLGEFKNDQMQTIPASDYYFDTPKYGNNTLPSISGGNNVTIRNGSGLQYMDWNGSGPSNRVSWRDKGNTMQRNGSTTHGKQIGVNYIIKY